MYNSYTLKCIRNLCIVIYDIFVYYNEETKTIEDYLNLVNFSLILPRH